MKIYPRPPSNEGSVRFVTLGCQCNLPLCDLTTRMPREISEHLAEKNHNVIVNGCPSRVIDREIVSIGPGYTIYGPMSILAFAKYSWWTQPLQLIAHTYWTMALALTIGLLIGLFGGFEAVHMLATILAGFFAGIAVALIKRKSRYDHPIVATSFAIIGFLIAVIVTVVS